MRLWSLHPEYLDAKGLVALWRETLLAQNVLAGNTKGYKNHPQLARFKSTSNPLGAIAVYLRCIADEADSRGYNFDKNKINDQVFNEKINVTSGQVEYERSHLLNKLKVREEKRYESFSATGHIKVHPLFEVIEGDVEAWEII
ncbi:pyrimidine dimer DNA glycosylase/endonuclease V [Sulfurovum sp. zt1-1]|uniref:Pyrimidine dimer DNA glycosylase/endonuclease V n=1 Tax=Sulfurovum zhangzhouensis TaxID=3019067 RepID=A0ABT7QY37_9BACT|nr:pyrimidine dimer DNA glycosylase/endonuclease V [Sulfurovum zhangzhouensis]MDM5271758.1 pyrimidine dimer DNA glycosylase/endonuclease V [Sulfurovum zhangzhouensis]